MVMNKNVMREELAASSAHYCLWESVVLYFYL